MKRIHFAMQLSVLTGALAFARSAQAADLYITNAGFEIPTLVQGVETYPYSVPGWVEYEPSYPWEWECLYPPANLVQAHGGQNVLSGTAYDPTTQYVEQQLTNTLQLNTVYTLSAWVADPDGHNPENSARLLLFAGTELLGTGTVQPTDTATWAQGSLVYQTGNIHPQAGQPLRIRIMQGERNSYRLFIDDVTLDATAIPPAVPLYTWDGTTNNWNSPHWNPGLVAWPGGQDDAQVSSGMINVPDANGAFQAGNVGIFGGVLNVTGVNGYAGVTNSLLLSGGTLNISGVSSHLESITLYGGTLAGTNPDASGNWILDSSVLADGGTTSTISAAQVALGDPQRDFQITGGTTLDISGTLRTSSSTSQDGLVKDGSGTLVLAGASTYDGQTTVNAGTLLVNNTSGSGTGTGDVTVNTGGTLGGAGIIAGNVVVQSGGTLAPGVTNIGTLTINNSLTLSGSIVMKVKKSGAIITNDLVRGATSLTYGGTLFINNLGDALSSGDSLHLFSAGSFNGAFAAISPSTPGAGLTWDTNGLAHGVLGVAANVVVGALYINNPGFEIPAGLAPGQEDSADGYHVPGWVEYEPSYPWEWDVLNPNAATLPVGAHGGTNVLNTLAYDPQVQYVEQQLTNTVQLHTRYTLSAWAVDPDIKNGGNFINNVKLLLYGGSTPLGSVTIQPTVNGVWTTGSLVYETGNSDPGFGQPLKIRIMWGNNASYRVFIDDVSLTAVPAAPSAPMYTWDGTTGVWNTTHWNAGSGLVSWPGAGTDGLVTNGTVNIPDPSGAFQAASMTIKGGTVNVSGTDGYAGVVDTIVLAGGQLALAGTSSQLGTLTLSGGTLAATTPDATLGSWQMGANLNAVGGVISTISAPQVALSDPARILDVSGGSTLNLSGSLRTSAYTSGDGLAKQGDGTLILAAANTYDGVTAINAGTLLVNNPTGSGTGSGDVTVNSGGTIGGTGIIGGNVTVTNGGTLAPGAFGIGTLSVSNSVTLGGNTVVEITKTGTMLAGDQLRVGGALTYGGSLIVTNSGDALAEGDSIKLFSAGSYSGSFTGIVPTSPGPGLAWNTAGLTNNGVLAVLLAAAPSGIKPLNNGNIEITVTGTVGQPYSLLMSTNVGLPFAQWTVLTSGSITQSPFTLTDTNTAGSDRRFYNLRTP